MKKGDDMQNFTIPGCPQCKGQVVVTEYECPECGITVRGRFTPGPFTGLNADQIRFVAAFIASDGSIKQIEARLGISYPTVKARLLEIKKILGLEDNTKENKSNEVLELLETGGISVEEALKRLEKER
jgi:hypothetical protein